MVLHDLGDLGRRRRERRFEGGHVAHLRGDGDGRAAALRDVIDHVGAAEAGDGLRTLRLEPQPLLDIGDVLGDDDLRHVRSFDALEPRTRGATSRFSLERRRSARARERAQGIAIRARSED